MSDAPSLSSQCECGHPWSHHQIVKGFECSPGVTIDGRHRIPDVWVCTGDHDQIIDSELSPWDYVCGCILHAPPPLKVVHA